MVGGRRKRSEGEKEEGSIQTKQKHINAACTSVNATGHCGHLSSSPTSRGGRFRDNFITKFTRTKSRN